VATSYVAILPNMGELIFVYDVRDDSFQVWETPPGVTVLDPAWWESATVVETGHVDYERTWETHKEICLRRDADFRGERVDQLQAYLETRSHQGK
jgi:hypothetical protein